MWKARATTSGADEYCAATGIRARPAKAAKSITVNTLSAYLDDNLTLKGQEKCSKVSPESLKDYSTMGAKNVAFALVTVWFEQYWAYYCNALRRSRVSSEQLR